MLAQDPPEGTEKADAPLGCPEQPRLYLATERTESPGSGLFLSGQHPTGPACLPEAGVMGLEIWLGGWAEGLTDADGGLV